MNNSKVVKILKKFDENEMEQLNLFLQSPFFKSPPHIDLLFFYLNSFYPKFSEMNKESAFEKIFSGSQTYNKELFNNIMSNLLKQIEIFMAHSQLQKNKSLSQQLAIGFYNLKAFPKLFEQRCNELLDRLKKNQYIDNQVYLKNYEINYLYYYYPSTQKHIQNPKLIKSMLENLDRYYMSEKLMLATEINIRKNILSEEQDVYLIEEVLNYAQEQELPIFKLYHHLYQMTNEKLNPKKFDLVKQISLQYFDQLSLDSKSKILLLLINQANLLVFSGAIKYRNDQHDLYKIGIQEKLFSLKGFMEGSIFYNIIAIAAILKKFKYAYRFIAQYQSLLDPKSREDALQLSMAFLHFHEGNFVAADYLFQSHTFSNQHYKLLANSLHLRCLFEETITQVHFENVFSKFSAAFRKFISRHKLLPLQKKNAYFNLIKITRLMIRSKQMNRVKKAKQLLKIQQLLAQEIVSKEWLEQKVNQFKIAKS